MKRFSIVVLLLSLSATTQAAQTSATTDSFNAVAYFTSELVNGRPVDRIDTAYLGQDSIVLYVDWYNMRMRAYRTEVRIVDPTGRVVGEVRNTILPSSGRYYTYYYYVPNWNDPTGEWTYQVYVDGRYEFEARIPVLAAN
jgi:hypothetical protein